MCLWTVLNSESNKHIDTKGKNKNEKSPRLLHSLLLFRYSILLNCVLFQLNSEFTALPLHSSLFSKQSQGIQNVAAAQKLKCLAHYTWDKAALEMWNPLSREQWTAAECRVTESKWQPGVQNSALCHGWSSLRTHCTSTRTMPWQHSKETTLKDLAQPDFKQEKSQNNRKTQFQSKTLTEKNKNVRVK